MADHLAHERAVAMFDSALVRTAGWPGTSPLREALRDGRERLGRPMRVALAGKIKAGKSTLANALIGEPVLDSGSTEVTYNVCWLEHGSTPALEVHYKDPARPAEHRPAAEYHRLGRRDGAARVDLDAVSHLVLRHPNRLLRETVLIDTPGLESFYREDEVNTRRSLAADVDAVVYLFSHGLAEADAAVAAEIQGPSLARATPLNAFGVLSRADAYWPDVDPLDAGREIIDGLHERFPRLRQLFFTVRPVSALAALGVQTLTGEEFASLRTLAGMSSGALRRAVSDPGPFCEWDDLNDATGLTAPARAALWDRLGGYGVRLCAERIRDGAGTPENLSAAVLEETGVSGLRRLIREHFGRRASALKFARAAAVVREAAVREEFSTVEPARRALARRIASEFEEALLSDPVFEWLHVLRRCYDGSLALTKSESEEIRGLFGDRGDSPADRLCLPGEDDPSRLRRVAADRLRRWQIRTLDHFGTLPEDREAARVVVRTYARLIGDLENAASVQVSVKY